MTASKGQVVEVQITSGRWSLAAVVKIISGDTVNLVAFTDGVNPWPDVSTPNGLVAGSITSVAKGTGVGEWRELAVPTAVSDAISAAIAAIDLSGDIDAAVAAAATTLQSNLDAAVLGLNGDITTLAGQVADLETSVSSGVMVLPAAGTDHAGLGFGTARQPSTTRPVMVTASGSFQITSALLGNQTAQVNLLSDSGSNPTTLRARAPGGDVGVVHTITIPWSVSYMVPAGHYYKLTESHTSNVTVAIEAINETPC